jgi:hypothetical protein
MNPLPIVSEKQPSLLVRAGIYLLVPVILLLALPIALLVIVALYLLAILQGARVFVFTFTNRQAEPKYDFPPPHFLEAPAPKALPDTSNPTQKG